MMVGIPLESLPKLNASLNAAATVFLVLGFIFIRSGKIRYHRFCMIVAFPVLDRILVLLPLLPLSRRSDSLRRTGLGSTGCILRY